MVEKKQSHVKEKVVGSWTLNSNWILTANFKITLHKEDFHGFMRFYVLFSGRFPIAAYYEADWRWFNEFMW